MKRLENYLVGYAVGIVLFFGAWWLASWAVSVFAAKPLQSAVPPPLRALTIFAEEWLDLVPHFFASGYRVLSGLLLSIVIAMPLGLVIGHERVLDRLLSPSIYLTYPIPKVVFLPLLFVFLGIYDAPKIGLITLVLVFQLLLSTRDAAKSVPKSYILSVISTGASKWHVYKHVVLPASLPAMFSALRISIGMAITALALTEAFASQYGLWRYIYDQWARYSNYERMFAGILAMGLLGLAFYIVIDLLERWICRWQHV
ncbi:MAG: ABC transporter permease [Candidatus Bipolaricaulota bacterium]|nr:ABC transporter permease [Candidatus Bipolaricaulota bacterium]MDW8031403.1 ABC transporter permease [Candidatus Bipolaricaulota bacterium]